MNSGDPLNEKAEETWQIIDNSKDSNDLLTKEVQQLQSLLANAPLYPLSHTNAPSTNHFKSDTSMNSDFLLIINYVNKVIYADKNGLKLWNTTSIDTVPKLNFSTKPQDVSHKRTKNAKLVLHENKIIDVIIEELVFASTIIDSPDLLFLIRPKRNKIPQVKSSSSGKLLSESNNTFPVVNSKPLSFSEPFELVSNTISNKKKKTVDVLDLNINKKLAEKLPLQILLAEDNLINQKLITLLLKKMGYFPDISMNGAEALKMLEKKRYDILFMDVQMPVMDGLEATRMIMSTWSKKMRPHIIAMTANVMHGDRERCMDAGMDDYLSKPIKFHEIEDVLMKWGSVLT